MAQQPGSHKRSMTRPVEAGLCLVVYSIAQSGRNPPQIFTREKKKNLISFQKQFGKKDTMILLFSSLERFLNSSKDDKIFKKKCVLVNRFQ